MGYRRKSREMALQMLFQGELYPEKESEELSHHFCSHFKVKKTVLEFGVQLFSGVMKHRDEINKLIETYSDHWKVHRMSYIDRNILRIALYEMIYLDDIPASVSIDEGIEIAKRYGSAESAAFVNGILDKIFKKEILAA